MGQVMSVMRGWTDLSTWSPPIGRGAKPVDDAAGEVGDVDRPLPEGGGITSTGLRMSAKDWEEYTLSTGYLLKLAVAAAAGFAVTTGISTRVAASADSRFARLSPVTRRRFPLYINSLIHAAGLMVFSFYKISRDPATVTLRGNRRLLAVTLGYFLNDLVATRHDWLSHPADLIHHVAGISVAGAALVQPQVTEFIPLCMVVEASTVFLNLMWLLRTAGAEKSWLYNMSSKTFVALFFGLRVVWLPIMTLHLKLREREKFRRLGHVRWGFVPVNALQFYWFFKIVQMLREGRG